MHQPLDGHLTHNAIVAATFEALSRVPKDCLPKKIIGCEVWRGLNWLPFGKGYPHTDRLTYPIDMSESVDRFLQLINCHKTQVEGGNDYTKIVSRWEANAALSDPHTASVIKPKHLAFGLDMTEFVMLMRAGKTDLDKYIHPLVLEFEQALQKSITASSPTVNTMVSKSAAIEPAFVLPPKPQLVLA